ncbi:hypothetical protein N177_0903 [Lutibaculum baratangense AMV1]|uniref:DUF2125 domain-containing protein n=2 Tax=Lutibaculum TaxID=1358438 RepID=V4TKQ3_9HYPH|nr:hypothetical protein N177_0903 [Lutibaculum baratangense AMV1]
MTDDRKRGLGRPPMALVVLVLLILAAIGAWSYFWSVASRRAEAALESWLAVEATQGRVHSCSERSTGGFPFRFEFVCESPSFTLSVQPEVVATGQELRAVLQVWRPEHVIVELDGPLQVASGPDLLGGSRPLVASWDLMQASLHMPLGRLRAIDVAADNLAVAPEGRQAAEDFALEARRLEFHQREGAAGPSGDDQGMDLAVSAKDLMITYPGATRVEPVDVNLVGSAVALTPELVARPREFLPRWQEAGGRFDIQSLVARQQDTRFIAQGNLQPEADGRLNGLLSLALAGPDVTSPGATNAFGGVAPFVATALRFIGERTEIEGEPAVRGELRLRNGKAYIGNFPVADLPRLF